MNKDILDPILAKNFNIEHFDTRIFAIPSCVPTEAIEVLKKICMDGNLFKKDDQNGPLSGGIYIIQLSCGRSFSFAEVGSAIAAAIAQ